MQKFMTGFVNKNNENNKQVNIEVLWLGQSNKIGIYNQYLAVIISVQLV